MCMSPLYLASLLLSTLHDALRFVATCVRFYHTIRACRSVRILLRSRRAPATLRATARTMHIGRAIVRAMMSTRSVDLSDTVVGMGLSSGPFLEEGGSCTPRCQGNIVAAVGGLAQRTCVHVPLSIFRTVSSAFAPSHHHDVRNAWRRRLPPKLPGTATGPCSSPIHVSSSVAVLRPSQENRGTKGA